jgi:hypothetical protein
VRVRLTVAGLVATAALVAAASAGACTCAPVDLERDLPLADGAFVGTVLEQREPAGGQRVVLFRVEQVYKGDIVNRVEVTTPRDSAACGLDAQVGERLGLLLERDGEDWRAGLCSLVEPAAFLELTDVEDRTLPPLNWGGVVVGVLVLAAGGFFLVRRLRRYPRCGSGPRRPRRPERR